RYVFLQDSTFLNEYLISHGIARDAKTSHLYQDEFALDEERAQNLHLGIWSYLCILSPIPTLSTASLVNVSLTITPTSIKIPTPTKVPTITAKSHPEIKGESIQKTSS